jgi:hypothetical protein
MLTEGDTIKLLCAFDKLENYYIIWKKVSGILAVGKKTFDRKYARIKKESRKWKWKSSSDQLVSFL